MAKSVSFDAFRQPPNQLLAASDLAAVARQLEAESAATHCKREQILRGAMQVFLEQGYANTSMDRAAAAAGVSKQTIYSHFQDKQGLFVALIERVTIRRLLSDFPGNPFEGEPEMVLRRLAESFLNKLDDLEYIAVLRLVIAESARFPELAQLYSQTVIQYGYRHLSDYFVAHPELQISDPEAVARIFFGSLVAFVLTQTILQGQQTLPMQPERLVNSLLQCILGDRAARCQPE